jgi:hypothetical protein
LNVVVKKLIEILSRQYDFTLAASWEKIFLQQHSNFSLSDWFSAMFASLVVPLEFEHFIFEHLIDH